MPAQELTTLMVAFGRMEEKIDSIVDHLTRLNGSVAKLQDTSNQHDQKITVLTTESGIWSKLSKPALLILVAVVSAVAGTQAHIGAMLDFLK
jgi:hypothetical protein